MKFEIPAPPEEPRRVAVCVTLRPETKQFVDSIVERFQKNGRKLTRSEFIDFAIAWLAENQFVPEPR